MLRTLPAHGTAFRPARPVAPLLPGLALCAAVTAAAYLIDGAERLLLGRSWLEPLVLAILAGTALRSAWTPSPSLRAGIGFGGKRLLEAAVTLLGATVSARTVLAAGPFLLAGIAATVAGALLLGFGIGRALGLSARMALLVACGNAICGNSAIAAVAPVIDAEGDDVAASIAFTAVLGVAAVLGLPVLGAALGMGPVAYGAFSGLTVYAVPQVLAATAPMGAAAMHVGTVVKLVRVLMLGPVCLVLALLAPHLPARAGAASRTARHPPLGQLVPPFILGFLLLATLRSLELLPGAAIDAVGVAATPLTVVSMAALGLGTDLRKVAGAGLRVTAAVVLSLAGLGAISLVLLAALHVA